MHASHRLRAMPKELGQFQRRHTTMAPHDPATDVLEACRTDLHVLTPETAPCGGIRAVVRYLAPRGKRAIGVGRATVTVEQLDVRRWPTRAPVAAARRAPSFGWCHNPLLLRFYDDPDVWTLSSDEGAASGPYDAGAFVSEGESPPSAFIRAHQEALILHGGRYGLYDVYRIHNPEEPLGGLALGEGRVLGARGGPGAHRG
jgi:hypothetical protein